MKTKSKCYFCTSRQWVKTGENQASEQQYNHSTIDIAITISCFVQFCTKEAAKKRTFLSILLPLPYMITISMVYLCSLFSSSFTHNFYIYSFSAFHRHYSLYHSVHIKNFCLMRAFSFPFFQFRWLLYIWLQV